MSAREAALARRSWSKVTSAAPTREELLPLVAAAGRVADHSSLRPWRLIELRGEDRRRLGAAISAVRGDREPSSKPLRAELLIAVVVSVRPSGKVPAWEQEAVASGVAHLLSLLLDEAGWGVIWRTGEYTRSPEIARLHGLGEGESLLGWLYVGGKPEKDPGRRRPVDAESVLSRLPADPGAVSAGPDDATSRTEGSSLPREALPRHAKPRTKPPTTPEELAERSERKRRKKAEKKRRKAVKKAKKAAARMRRLASSSVSDDAID